MPILGASTPGSFGNLSPTFAPTSIWGCIQWMRADQVVLSSGNVTSWPDLSGSGNGASQGNATYQPLWISNNTVIGQPTIRLSGATGTWLSHPLGALVNNTTIWVVVASVTQAASNFRCLYGTSAGVMLCSSGAGAGDFGAYIGAYNDGGVSVLDGQGHAIAWVCSTPTTTQTFYADNNATTTTGTSAYTGAPGVIGAGNTVGGQTMGGEVAEIAVWNRQLAATDIAALSQYAAGRYGIFTP